MLSLFCAAAETAAPAKRGRLSVISTAYFDFIHPEASAGTAAYLAQYADGMADEICRLLDTSMKGRIPVYLDPDIQLLNAYYTPFPYNRIVLYDTTDADGSLGSFRDAILKVFYHELTHAVSINVRTPFWQLMSEVFGDIVSVNFLVTMPLSFLEGVTVSFESSDGEGRLNDPFTRHFYVQDKIEGKTPSWKDVAGSRDIYPGAAASYLYGGAFSAWLQDTYGMEKYAGLWKRGGGFNPFTGFLQTRFRQVYGIPVAEAWDAFLESIPVPPRVGVNANTLSTMPDGIYSALAASPAGLAFSDGNAGAVLYRRTDGSVERLFDTDGTLNRLSFSDDGTLLLVSDAKIGGDSAVLRTRVFDMERKHFLPELYGNLRDASFAGSTGLVCGIESRAQTSHLVLLDRTAGGGRRILLSAGPEQPFYSLYNPVAAGPFRLALIGANGLDRRLLFIDTATGTLSSPEFPGEVRNIRFLRSASGDQGPLLSFGWANENTLYRHALYRPESDVLELQDRDYSGGVFNPVPDPASSRVFYAASFSGRDTLAFLDTGTGYSPVPVSPPAPLPPAPLPPATSGLPAAPVPRSRFYNPLPWFLDGVFLPFPSFLPIDTGIENLAPGFVYITGDPTERYAFTVNPAFSADPFFADVSFRPVLRAEGFTFAGELSDHLKPSLGGFEPYRESSASLTVERPFVLGPVWKNCTVSVTAAANSYAPDISGFDSPYDAPFRASSLSAETALSFSAIRKKHLPSFPLFAHTESGLEAAGDLYLGRVFPDRKTTPVLQGSLSFRTPVVPLSLTVSGAFADGLSFSPVSVYATALNVRDFGSGISRYIPVFPEYSDTGFETLNSSRVIAAVAELTFLTVEIQRGLPVLPLYANRIVGAAGYRSALFGALERDPVYLDSVYARTTVQASVIVGALTSAVLSGYAEYGHALRAGSGRLHFGFGFAVEL